MDSQYNPFEWSYNWDPKYTYWRSIGGGDMDSQYNPFEWPNNRYPTNTNWRSIDGGDMDYLGCFAMGSGINGGWYELNCTTPLAGICKTTVGELYLFRI